MLGYVTYLFYITIRVYGLGYIIGLFLHHGQGPGIILERPGQYWFSLGYTLLKLAMGSPLISDSYFSCFTGHNKDTPSFGNLM